MNINECYEYIQLVSNKEQGGFISPEDFNRAIDAAQMEFFNDRYGQPATYQPGRPVPVVGYPQSQKVHDDISILMEFERVYDTSLNPYKDLKNGEYLHFVGAYYLKNTGYEGFPIHKERYPIDFLEYDKYNFNRRSTMFDVDDKDRPSVVFNDEKYFFFGVDLDQGVNPNSISYNPSNVNNGDELYFIYLRRPKKPIWNYYNDLDGRPTYSKECGVIPVKQLNRDLSVKNAVDIRRESEPEINVANASSSAGTIFTGFKHHNEQRECIFIPNDEERYIIIAKDEKGNPVNNYDNPQGEIVEFTLSTIRDGQIITEPGLQNEIYVNKGFNGTNLMNFIDINQNEYEHFSQENQNTDREFILQAPGGQTMSTYPKLLGFEGSGYFKLNLKNSVSDADFTDDLGRRVLMVRNYDDSDDNPQCGIIIKDYKRFSTGSVDLELPQQTHLEICMRALGYLGINLSEAQLVQYAEGKQTQTPGV